MPGNEHPRRLPMTVTFLEMPPSPRPCPRRCHAARSFLRSEHPPVHFYRYLYDAVGSKYFWVDRKKISDDKLADIIHAPNNTSMFCTRTELRRGWRNWIFAPTASPTSPISG